MGRRKGEKTAKRRTFWLYERDEVLLNLVSGKMNEDQARDRDANDSDALRECIRGSMQRFGVTKKDLATATAAKQERDKPAAD